MKVFISHINADAQVAAVLAQWIESSLDRDVHLSGEVEDVPLDAQRRAGIDRALDEAKAALLLCSARSIGHPWISFEAGCAWLKGLPVFAACHGGCFTAGQPAPLGSLPVVDLTDAGSCRALLDTLAGLLQKKRVPRIDYNQMVSEIAAAVTRGAAQPSRAAAAAVATQASTTAAPAAAAPQAAAAAPQAIATRLLAAIGRQADFSYTAPDLAIGLGASEWVVRQCLDTLVSDDLLAQRISTLPTDPETRYACTDRGRSYLANHAA